MQQLPPFFGAVLSGDSLMCIGNERTKSAQESRGDRRSTTDITTWNTNGCRIDYGLSKAAFRLFLNGGKGAPWPVADRWRRLE